MTHKKTNGLALRQQLQALTSKPSTGKQADPIVNEPLRDILSQIEADDAFDVILGDTQSGDYLADAMLRADNPRVFLAQIQKRIARAYGKS